jgi:hypothetical protein
MKNDIQELNETLESLLDKNRIVELCVALELVCADKADHIQSSYGDKALAKEWQKASAAFFGVARKFNKSVIG